LPAVVARLVMALSLPAATSYSCPPVPMSLSAAASP